MGDPNLNPYDVDALERSLNDSAVRVSTIWVSFLVFGLYLVIAAGSITHLQLLLNEPIKLPVLDTKLPLVGFFYVAPVLFVIFHCYVLMQVLLLSRTATAYNEAVEHTGMAESDRARIRQRLANTLFAQIFSGSPQERKGLLGVLLWLLAWVTLAIGPVLVLLIYQTIFLPYQNPGVTLTHRILIVLDLALVIFLWGVNRTTAFVYGAVVVASLTAYFPGELQSWLPAKWRSDIDCGDPRRDPPSTDRLVLPQVDVVDDEKLAKIEAGAKSQGLPPHRSERTHDFSNRNLRCADFSRADFRHANFTEADLQGANLAYAQLQGAVLSGANLTHADLQNAQMQGADLGSVPVRTGYRYYQGSYWTGVKIPGARLPGALLWNAQLQGARLARVDMPGASLLGAQMQGASLIRANLVGADLSGGASMQAADLRRADLRGATLKWAQMHGANLFQARLERTRFNQDTILTLARIRHAFLWQAAGANCHDAQVSEPRLELMHLPPESFGDIVIKESKATPDQETNFVDEVVSGLPQLVQRRVREDFEANPPGTTEDAWGACEMKALTGEDYVRKHADFLIKLACEPTYEHMYLLYGIYHNWIEAPDDSVYLPPGPAGGSSHYKAVIQGLLLRLDSKECPGANELGNRMIERLRHFARVLNE
jgi:uncharacterized protein YjbI with pentapeptide repeats